MRAERLLVGLAMLLGLAGGVGCKDTRPLIVGEPRISVHYDTKYEELLNSEKSVPLIEGAWRPYVETLDEPVAVVEWQDGVSTWEVFFATNRSLLPASDPAQQRYGNGLAREPHFGRAEITLPRRQRGGEPARVADAAHAAVRFGEVRRIAWDDLAAGVRGQLAASRQQDLLLFVHGFNVDFESALIRTAQIALDMPFNGAVVAYSWPSQANFQQYGDDEAFNAGSVAPFTEFLSQLVAAVPPGTRINIVAHSMGNRIVMQAIGGLPVETARPLGHVALCAPDVGRADFERWIPGVLARSERVTLYASAGDAALAASRSLHSERRAGDAMVPLVYPGLETIDCTAVDLDFLGHSYYGSNVDVLADLFAALKERRTASERPYLTRRDAGGGQCYWQFTAHAPRLLWTWNFGEGKLR
ncbi:MAG: alpha/beta fold hydrolase [Pirellulaceae bacterium]|nr:alpha/beta fold hydrolase [Pirellulaceae bacterium]